MLILIQISSFQATLELRQVHSNNADALRVIYSSLFLICKVFNSLNSQDLPEYFEDNMPIWMPNLLSLLLSKVPIIETNVSMFRIFALCHF